MLRPSRRLVAVALWCIAAAAAPRAQETAAPDRKGGSAPVSECARCHERQHRRIRDGAHGPILHTEVLPGCETCHGPGEAHAVDADNDPTLITMPALLDPGAQVALCSRCHLDQVRLHGGDPDGFLVADRACTDCHSVHDAPRATIAPDLRLRRRDAAAAHARETGSAACVECHPLRDSLLAASAHAELAAGRAERGCERCHGAGSLHVETGEGRLITRPDRAEDGVATCRGCHEAVDGVEFHWVGRKKPYLSAGVTCTTCHLVHTAATPEEAAPDAAPPTNAVCAVCHAAAFATMPGSTHQRVGAFDTPLDEGCGSCHVGSREHARAGGRRELLVRWADDAGRQAEVCLACHQDERGLAHVRHGDHLRHGVGCTDCHGPLHGARHGDTAARAEERCAGCHAAAAAEFRQPNHHPVPEGTMRCTACHDPHGGRRRQLDLRLTRDACVECHTRYRGPFVFAHQADRRGGCTVCHVPHGSPNRRLLRQTSTRQNCLQCHGDFPAFHDQTSGAVFTNCIRCHTEVHGSDHSRYFFR